MAAPVVLQGTKFRVYVSDGTAGDSRFKFFCTATQRQFNQSANFEEVFLPDCADPDKVPARTSRPTGTLWNLQLDGVLDPNQPVLAYVRAAFQNNETIEIKIVEDVAGGTSYTGFAWVESLQVAAAGGGNTTMQAQLRGEGALTYATVV